MAIKMALQSIFANKMRSFLTMLGITVGVFSLIVLVSLVSSATNAVTSQISAMGSDMLIAQVLDNKGSPLSMADIRKISDKSSSVSLICPVSTFSGIVTSGGEDYPFTVEATIPSRFSIESLSASAGRLLKTADQDNGTFVTVISLRAAEKLFGSANNAVGQDIYFAGAKFNVVGVLTAQRGFGTTALSSDTVYIPFSVVSRIYPEADSIVGFYAAASSPDRMEQAKSEIEGYLLERFKNDDKAFMVVNMDTLSSTLGSVTAIFALLFGGIAAISLIVGGIGIMNIMLVSVTERTKEIGIRKAIGARPKTILRQFLIEALFICLIGCVLGVLLAGLVLFFISLAAGGSLKISYSPGVIVASVFFSTAIGLIFGIYPARKAAHMMPIEALRHE